MPDCSVRLLLCTRCHAVAGDTLGATVGVGLRYLPVPHVPASCVAPRPDSVTGALVAAYLAYACAYISHAVADCSAVIRSRTDVITLTRKSSNITV